MHPFVQSYKIRKLVNDLKKAGPSSPSPSPGGIRDFPVGTIRNGRQKVSSHPSVWVDLKDGHSFNDHQSPEKHKVEAHPEYKERVASIMKQFKTQLHPDDVERAKTLFTRYFEQKLKQKNLQRAGNVDSKESGKLSKPIKDDFHKLADKTQKAKETLLSFIKQSKARLRNENNGSKKED